LWTVQLGYRRQGRSSDRPAAQPWIGRHETGGFRSSGRWWRPKSFAQRFSSLPGVRW